MHNSFKFIWFTFIHVKFFFLFYMRLAYDRINFTLKINTYWIYIYTKYAGWIRVINTLFNNNNNNCNLQWINCHYDFTVHCFHQCIALTWHRINWLQYWYKCYYYDSILVSFFCVKRFGFFLLFFCWCHNVTHFFFIDFS